MPGDLLSRPMMEIERGLREKRLSRGIDRGRYQPAPARVRTWGRAISRTRLPASQ